MLSKHFYFPLFITILLAGIVACVTIPGEEKTGEIDTKMGGDLEVNGIVHDNQDNVVSNVFVRASAYSPGGGGDEGTLGNWELYTDTNGKYAFKNFNRDIIGHIELWFNGGEEYGKEYENCGYNFLDVNTYYDYIYTLDIVVYPVTESGIKGDIKFVDSDGVTKNLVEWPDSFIGLERGSNLTTGHEYSIGSEYGEIIDGKIRYTGLAGGTYFFVFHFNKSNGNYVDENSDPILIPEGEILNYQYTVD